MSDPILPPAESTPPASAVWPPRPITSPSTDSYIGPDIREFEAQNGWVMFSLLLVTFGVYGAFWLVKIFKVINRIAPDFAVPIGVIWFWLLLRIVELVFIFAHAASIVSSTPQPESLQSMTRLTQYGADIYLLILAYRIRAAMNMILQRSSPNLRRLGKVGTFFNLLYLQVRLNQRIQERNMEVGGAH